MTYGCEEGRVEDWAVVRWHGIGWAAAARYVYERMEQER